MRTLLFTGKGGVGKTTVAAATALRAAALGHRTLVVSTDAAHSLADALAVPLGAQPTPVAPLLHGQQVDAVDRMEEAWADIRVWLAEVFDWAGLDAVEAEELSVLPGLEEVFGLVDLKGHADSGRWDVLVVDCAPTAETIRFLSLPDVLEWYMGRVFPVGRQVNRLLAPVLRRTTDLPVAGDRVFRSVHRLYERLEGVKAVLTDQRRSSVRLVVNPERLVVAEARRTFTYLSLFGYTVDAVVANRLLPDDLTDPWFDRWRAAHAAHLDEVVEAFSPVPVLRVDLAPDEPVGVDSLGALGRDLWDGRDPTAVLCAGVPLRVEAHGDVRVLELALPLADHDELDVARHGADLLVRVGPYRRPLALPDSLRRRPVTGASLRDGRLRISFGPTRGTEESTR